MTNAPQDHPSADKLLLFAYGEMPSPRAAEIEAHLAGCGTCHAQFADLERARVALDVAMPPPARPAGRRPRLVWAAGLLAAAAVLAAVLLTDSGPGGASQEQWAPTTWSATAGYVAGGKAVVDIDAQLTRLEQESRYGRP